MNKKIITTILPILFLYSGPIAAQSEDAAEKKTEAATEEQTEAPLQEIGLDEAPAQRPKNDSNMKNWLFAAGSVVCATVAAVIVSLSPGSPPSGNSQQN